MKLLYVNMKRLNPCGIIYTKLGAIINNDHAFGAQVVIRYPKVLTEIDNNGYYFEDYTGHLDSKTYGQDDVMQLGAGEKASVNDYTLIDGTAAIQFAYTLSL